MAYLLQLVYDKRVHCELNVNFCDSYYRGRSIIAYSIWKLFSVKKISVTQNTQVVFFNLRGISTVAVCTNLKIILKSLVFLDKKWVKKSMKKQKKKKNVKRCSDMIVNDDEQYSSKTRVNLHNVWRCSKTTKRYRCVHRKNYYQYERKKNVKFQAANNGGTTYLRI